MVAPPDRNLAQNLVLLFALATAQPAVAQQNKSPDRPQEKARPAESPASSSDEELAAIAWVKSVDGRIIRATSKPGLGPVDYVGLRRGNRGGIVHVAKVALEESE